MLYEDDATVTKYKLCNALFSLNSLFFLYKNLFLEEKKLVCVFLLWLLKSQIIGTSLKECLHDFGSTL